MALSSKQLAFIEHYLATWNGAEAARLAGYSEKTAKEQASRMLTEVNVQDAITERLAELKMSADEVLVRLSEHARGSIAPFLRVTSDGEMRGFDLNPEQPLHLVRRATATTRRFKDESTEYTVTVELHDAQAALALLARHHGLLVERTETTINVIDDAVTTLERKLLPRMADDSAAGVSGEPDPAGEGGAAL